MFSLSVVSSTEGTTNDESHNESNDGEKPEVDQKPRVNAENANKIIPLLSTVYGIVKDKVTHGEEHRLANELRIVRRYYGPYGKAETDIDYTDHGVPWSHPKVPHRHDFDWSKKKSRSIGYSVLTDKFPDKGVTVIYTYVNLVEDVGIGHEVVFTYNSLKYSITQGNDGWYFTSVVDNEIGVFYLTSDDLLDQVRIEGETLQQVFDSVNVSDLSIY